MWPQTLKIRRPCCTGETIDIRGPYGTIGVILHLSFWRIKMRRVPFRCLIWTQPLFPGLEVQFFTTKDGDLVPVQRGIIRKPVKDRTASFWELIIGPGKVWKEKDKTEDYKGWDKAAFPFSLVQSQEGEALIGLAYFYYKGKKVSNLYYQVSNDTAGGFIFWDVDFNMTAWGEVEMTYKPGKVKKEKDLEKAYKKEVANRLPMKPLSELGEAVDGLGGDVDPNHALTMAMVVDNATKMPPSTNRWRIAKAPARAASLGSDRAKISALRIPIAVHSTPIPKNIATQMSSI